MPSKKWELFGFALIALLFAAWAINFIYKSSVVGIDGQRYFVLFDDAMISMRYAWNFSHGHGLVWNPGERVEGYTNPLMVLIMALPSYFLTKSSAVLTIQLIGIATVISIAYVSGLLAKKLWSVIGLKPTILVQVLVGVLIFTYYPLVYWTLMGMETGLLTFLLLGSIYFTFDYISTDKLRSWILVNICLLLAYLTRPDSVIFVPIIIAVAFISFRNTKFSKKQILRFGYPMLILLVGVVGHVVFRQTYYGELVPNTYTLKISGSLISDRIGDGFGFILPYLKTHFLLYVFALVGLLFKRTKETVLLISISVISIFYQIWTGGESWPYWRMLAPTIPVLFVLSLFSLNKLVILNNHALNTKAYVTKQITSALIIGLFGLNVLVINSPFLREILFIDRPYQVLENEENLNDALAIMEVTEDNTASVGVFWAGTIPFYTGYYAIDFLGKSDPYIASLKPDVSGAVGWGGMNSVPGHNKYDLDYSIKQKKPTYVQGFVWGKQDLTDWGLVHYHIEKINGNEIFILD